MPNWTYLGIAITAGIIGIGTFLLSPILVIGDATQAVINVNIFICGGICAFFTFAGVVS